MSLIAGRSARWKWAVAGTVLVVLALVVIVIVNGHGSPTSAGHSDSEASLPTVATTPPPSGSGSLTSEQQLELEQSIARARNLVQVDAATSPQYPAVGAEARQQPDLYAAAFVRELLTQDYRTSRNQLLAWLQSESAQSTEQLVVGLTPVELRGTMAVASVQDEVKGPSPVPSESDWAVLAGRQGHTTVQIQRVSDPVSWAGAVAKAQITDPGVTARQVDAEVTLQTTDFGKAIEQKYNAALVINLEGPPVRDGYGFVTAITYNVVKVP
ncbi:MAG: hypothetical protein ABI903_18160 [Actinomycetota bacterium]